MTSPIRSHLTSAQFVQQYDGHDIVITGNNGMLDVSRIERLPTLDQRKDAECIPSTIQARVFKVSPESFVLIYLNQYNNYLSIGTDRVGLSLIQGVSFQLVSDEVGNYGICTVNATGTPQRYLSIGTEGIAARGNFYGDEQLKLYVANKK